MSNLDAAVRAVLRDVTDIGSLTALREAAALSGEDFVAVRRGRRPVSPKVARRLARTFRAWADQCTRRAARITSALNNAAAVAGEDVADVHA